MRRGQALWRDQLVSLRLLLVLDDAVGSEQVQPLLPGAGDSLVLVTSRRHLTALEDATAISLDTLAPGEAAALFVRLAARPGLSLDDAAVGEIIRLCGYLPLAIGMLARQLHHHPAWSLAGRAAELAAERDRLELMATENVSVAAAFDLSYQDLAADQQLLFRRLGLHPGTEFDGHTAAALDGTGLAAARRGLEVLYDQYLLAEAAQGRYRMHDLIRQHARALADRLTPSTIVSRPSPGCWITTSTLPPWPNPCWPDRTCLRCHGGTTSALFPVLPTASRRGQGQGRARQPAGLHWTTLSRRSAGPGRRLTGRDGGPAAHQGPGTGATHPPRHGSARRADR